MQFDTFSLALVLGGLAIASAILVRVLLSNRKVELRCSIANH